MKVSFPAALITWLLPSALAVSWIQPATAASENPSVPTASAAVAPATATAGPARSGPAKPAPATPPPTTTAAAPTTAAETAPASKPPDPAPAAQQESATSAAPAFKPLDVIEWVILDAREDSKGRPWILIVDDPQCPYCMQLSLALEKSREAADPEISRAAIAHVPFPLAYHDQSAHIVSDAFCLEATRANQPWSAAAYLDWLIVAPWRTEPDWKTATLDDLEKDGGFFDARYDKHRVTSSRRREFQTERAKAESACTADSCHGDSDCEALCLARKTCVAACPGASTTGATGDSSAPGSATAGPGSAGSGNSASSVEAANAPSREKCIEECNGRFVSARYRQFSKVHSACLLEEGPGSAHAKTAAVYAWAVSHKVPGTPTVYVGHPSIGFRLIGDSDHLKDFLVTLRKGISEARAKMSASAPAPAAR